MATSLFNYTELQEPTVQADVNIWGGILNAVTAAWDRALAGIVVADLSSADFTPDTTQAQNVVIKATGTLSANRKIIIPAKNRRYLVWNDASGAFTVSIGVSGQNEVTVPAGGLILVYCDGTDTVRVEAGISSISISGNGITASGVSAVTLTIAAALSGLGALTPAANKLPYYTSGSAAALTDITAFARSLLDDGDAATMRTTLGAQGTSALLTSIAGLSTSANQSVYFTAANTAATYTLTSFARTILDDSDAAAVRTTLGLGSLATASSINNANWSGTELAIANGGTGATTASAARTALEAETLGEISAINTQTGTSYTLVLADKGKTVERSNSSANTLTVPPNSSVAFPTNSYINVVQMGTGQTTIVAGSGVTIRSRNGLKLGGQYAMATLYKRGTNEWVLGGDVTP